MTPGTPMPPAPPTTLCRPAKPPLRPFIALAWAADGTDGKQPPASRELVLPTGMTHIVFRLGGHPLRLFDGREDRDGHPVGTSVIGGVRAAPYLKDISKPAPTVGIMLRPGAIEILTGTPAGALAHTHTNLEDVWTGPDLAELRERLEGTADLGNRLQDLEAFLTRRLPTVWGIDPLIAHALARFDAGDKVGDVVTASGYSHRHLARTFTNAVGLTPKTYCRVGRFGRLLDRLQSEPTACWADLAAAEGYADQAHMAREFREFAGVTPGDYRRAGAVHPRHVPVDTGVRPGQISSRRAAPSRAD